MDPVKRLVELLDDPSTRKRIAAAVVVGELGIKDSQVVAKLIEMAKDPLDAYAEAAIEALGQLKALKALPVLLDSLGRSKDVQGFARTAISQLGEEALPELRARLADAKPEVRAVLSVLLPAVGGRASFELALEGMRHQPWEAINRVALSVRQEARTMSEAEKRVMKTQVEKFLAKKKTVDDEPALRGALKVLGFLELADSQDLLLTYVGPKQPALIRVEAATALRFACARGPAKKSLRALMVLLVDTEPLVARAARDSLTVLKIGTDFADELAELCSSQDTDVALWAIRHLGELAIGSKGASATKTLLPVARGGDRARAEAAARVLAALPNGASLLVAALADADDEVGAMVLAEVLGPHSATLPPKDVKALLAAGIKNLGSALAIARRQLEPVRAANAEAWREALRTKAKAIRAKDPARAELISQLLGRSGIATVDDRFEIAVQQLLHHSLDPHPRARQRDPALSELERLHAEGFAVAVAVSKHKKLGDDARYYVGVHFAEKPQVELKNVGAEVLELVAAKVKGKLAKAAKNKIKLLEL